MNKNENINDSKNRSKREQNYAFIDGQNLYIGTVKKENDAWSIDLKKFRIYLAEKYFVTQAFYHLGYVQNSESIQQIYEKIQTSGFVLVFRQHHQNMAGSKKGNVDSDIVFAIMKKIYKHELFDKVILVSGDGDYKNLVDFLIEENKFKKILFPDKKRASSLYKKIGSKFYDFLENIKIYIESEVNKKGS
ncbi:MAG: NYN domain-containing protein [bacterium]